MYAGYPGSWAPGNMASASLYNNPGYGATAGQLGLNAQPAAYDYGSNVVVQPDAKSAGHEGPADWDDRRQPEGRTEDNPSGVSLPSGAGVFARVGHFLYGVTLSDSRTE